MKIKKDNFYAKTALILSLGFWIPLFNIGLTIVSIFFSLKALNLVDKHPKKFSGRTFAIIALVLSITTLVAMLAGIIYWLYLKV